MHRIVELIKLVGTGLIVVLLVGASAVTAHAVISTSDETDTVQVENLVADESTSDDEVVLNFGGGIEPGDISKSELQTKFCNAKVGFIVGLFAGRFMQRNCSNPQTLEYNADPELLEDLMLGKLDYTLLVDATAQSAVNEGIPIEPASETVYTAFAAAFVNNDNLELQAEVNAAIEQLRADGTLAEMEDYWVNSASTPSFTRPSAQLSDVETGTETDTEMRTIRVQPTGEGEVLRVLHYATLPPLSYLNSDGSPSGFCPELAVRIANLLNRRIEVSIVDIHAMIATIVTGKADIAMDFMYPLAEREKVVKFTTPYLAQKSHFFKRTDGEQSSSATSVDSNFWNSLTTALGKNFLEQDRYKFIITGLEATVTIAVGAFLLASILGMLLLLLSLMKNKVVEKLIQLFKFVVNGLPVLVILFITYYIIFASYGVPAIISAIISLGIAYTPLTFAAFKSGVDSVNVQQIQAARAMGFSVLQVYKMIVLPLSFRYAFEKYIFSFIDILKQTSIVGFVAIIDLTRAVNFIRSHTFDATVPIMFIAITYILLVVIFTKLFKIVAMRLAGANKRVNTQLNSRS